MTDMTEKSSFIIPRSSTGLSHLWSRFIKAAAQRKIHRLNRAAFENLLGKDDRTLADIGITRADVEWGARLPLNRNAALEVDQLRRARSA